MTPHSRSLVLAVVAATVFAGCGSDRPTENVEASTVRLRSIGCGPRPELGMGTVIEDGLVLTAAHVVAGSDQVIATMPDGAETTTDVVLFDPGLDLAVLRLPTSSRVTAVLREKPAETGERGIVATFGAEGMIELVEVEVLRDVKVRTTDIYRDADVERPGFEIAAAIERGDSGAMVHLPGGGVGVVWSRSTVNADRAWATDLPLLLYDAERRRALTDVVGTGPCL